MNQSVEAMLVLGWFSRTQQRIKFVREVSRRFGLSISEAKNVLDSSLNLEEVPVIVSLPPNIDLPWADSDEAEQWFLSSFGVSVMFVSRLSEVDTVIVRRVVESVVSGVDNRATASAGRSRDGGR